MIAGRSLVRHLSRSSTRRRPLPTSLAPPFRATPTCVHCFSTSSVSNSDSHGSLSSYDKSAHWRDWFNGPEYINAWSDEDIEPLDDAPTLDRQSRMVLHLLNKLYQVGLTRTVDRVTTERVHAIMQQLEDLPQQSANSRWQRAERGRILLEAMEQFEELRKVQNLPLPLPLPTHETYWRVLRMYSSKYLHGTKEGNRNVPLICLNMVQRMQDSRHLELQPTAMHWNQVLSAYANSTSDDRPLEAAKLLYELDSKGMTDASSFSHALRACSALSVRHQSASYKFVERAIPVARRIWAGLKKSESIDIQPFHFTHMLRVFRLEQDAVKRDENVHRIFAEAIEAQKVNIHVLNEMLQVASPDLMSKLLGMSSYPTDAKDLIRKVPSEWIEVVEEGGKSPYAW